MDGDYQGLGPDERMLLRQLFREAGEEERGAPEIEMHDRGGDAAENPVAYVGILGLEMGTVERLRTAPDKGMRGTSKQR